MAYTEMASFLNKLTGKLLEDVNLFHEVVEDRVWSLLFMLKKLRPFVMELQRRQREDKLKPLMKDFIGLLNEADDAIDIYITTTTPRRTENISGSSKDKDVDQKAGEALTGKIERIKLELKKWHTRCLEDKDKKVEGQKDEVNETTTSTPQVEEDKDERITSRAPSPQVEDKEDKIEDQKDEVKERIPSTVSSPQVEDKDDNVVGQKGSSSEVEDTDDKVVGMKNEENESIISSASTPHVEDKDDNVEGQKDEIEEKTTSTASSPQVEDKGERITSTDSIPQVEDKDDKVVGLKDEVKKMIELLNDKDPRPDVIPIVGPGGVGKTTLAFRVYNHPSTRKNFPCRAWIPAFNDYPLPMKDLLKKIIDEVREFSKLPGRREEAAAAVAAAAVVADNDHHGQKKILRDLAIQTYKLLKTCGRYLFVFDNVWRTQFWTDINMIFPDVRGGGGRIIFTTRYSEVALYARPRRPPVYLKPSLNNEESWELFCKKVASRSRDNIASTSSGGPSVESQSQSQSQPEPNHPWKEWVDACGGLPLAIVKLAEEHQRQKSSSPVDKEDKERFSKGIWELIYNSLPDELKPCLLYLGVINSFRYTQFMELIIAEGLVQPPRMTTVRRQKIAGEVEDYDIIAKEYVTELIKRNLFEVVSKQWDGSIKEIAISKRFQLMNFCISKAKEENFLNFLVPENKNLVQEANRGALQWQHENFFELKNPGTSSTMKPRSLLILESTMWASERIFSESYWVFVLNNYSSLRVLDLFGVDLIHNIPSDIGSRLVHLRYLRLNLKEFGNIRLPPSIFNLWNLQFLRVKRSNSRWLSSEIQLENFWRMRQFMHILCSDVIRLPQPPPPPSPQDDFVGDNLQMLKYVSAECCTKDLFSRIPNLVKLGVGGSILQGHINEMYSNLQVLTRLQKLGLKGSATNDPLSLHKWEGASLQNITHLTFKRTRLVGDTMKILGGKLPNLQVLKLSSNAVVGDELYGTTDASGFRKLKCLKFEKLDIRKWNLSVGAMPTLEIVIIRNCRALQGLPSEALYKIETLRELEVYHYGDLSVETDAEEVRQKRAGKDPPLQLRLERGIVSGRQNGRPQIFKGKRGE
ncbi:probable disease resistance RPP8-like protein 4 [Macadamia integrifolia]|uniref:probable disease resistance RPP8-like protein 4 n=1 Tax=Macadamia integrifolia TaxID=60698 RepID=UPI001C4E66FB|nr:probable disease resistance RPP8-like protein 4 [Macadamia integrifolia]